MASSAPPPPTRVDKDGAKAVPENGQARLETTDKKDEDDFSSKAQIMTLMTTDVDRVSEFAFHVFSLVGACLFSSLNMSFSIIV